MAGGGGRPLGEQTRPHDGLDLALEQRDIAPFLHAMGDAGFRLLHDDGRPFWCTNPLRACGDSLRDAVAAPDLASISAEPWWPVAT